MAFKQVMAFKSLRIAIVLLYHYNILVSTNYYGNFQWNFFAKIILNSCANRFFQSAPVLKKTIRFPFCRIVAAKSIEFYFLLFLEKDHLFSVDATFVFVALKFVCNSSFAQCDRFTQFFSMYFLENRRVGKRSTLEINKIDWKKNKVDRKFLE